MEPRLKSLADSLQQRSVFGKPESRSNFTQF